jgi:tRNA A-37 threonylcarbamoyl transferase component Bud32
MLFYYTKEIERVTKIFELDINNDSWELIKQSIDAFELLIKAIFNKHGLVYRKAENLPGVNAVFKVGDKVIKIFAPVESGFYSADYYEIETEALNHAKNVQVASPELLFKGIIDDKYIFRYIIMEFIDGQVAEHKIVSFTEIEKRAFSTKVRNITDNLNVNMQNAIIPVFSLEVGLLSDRWNRKDLPESFYDDRISVIKEMLFDDLVYVHGDQNGKNIIIDDNGDTYIIDYAGRSIAPYYCEWWTIVFLLFKCNPTMMAAYFGDYRNEAFYNQLTKSILISEFGVVEIKEMCEAMAVDINTLTDISKLKELIVSCLEDGNVHIKY